MEDVVSGSASDTSGRSPVAIDLVGIDFDGVVIDSAPAIALCMVEAFERQMLEPPDEGSIRSIIGAPLEVGLAELLTARTIEVGRTGGLVEEYRTIYRERASGLTAVYPGIVDAIDRIRASGRIVAVVTSKPREMTELLVEELGLRSHLDRIECQAPGDDSKAVALGRVLKSVAVDPQRTAVVGDRSHDVRAALDVGAVSIGVLWGYGSREELTAEGAHFLIDAPVELPPLVGV